MSSTIRKRLTVCLLAGSLSSDVLAERDLQRSVVRDMKAFSGQFVERLASAKQSGELPQDFNAEVTAQVLVTYLQGLFRVIRVLQSPRLSSNGRSTRYSTASASKLAPPVCQPSAAM